MNSPPFAGQAMGAITLSFRFDGLSHRISEKVTITTNGVAESTMEGYLYDGWNPVMITTLDPANTTGETVQGRKWSCLWRPDVGSSLYARSSWQIVGGVGGLAWLQTGNAHNLSTGGTSGAIVTGTHRFRQQLDVGGKIKNSVKRGGNRREFFFLVRIE